MVRILGGLKTYIIGKKEKNTVYYDNLQQWSKNASIIFRFIIRGKAKPYFFIRSSIWDLELGTPSPRMAMFVTEPFFLLACIFCGRPSNNSRFREALSSAPISRVYAFAARFIAFAAFDSTILCFDSIFCVVFNNSLWRTCGFVIITNRLRLTIQ